MFRFSRYFFSTREWACLARCFLSSLVTEPRSVVAVLRDVGGGGRRVGATVGFLSSDEEDDMVVKERLVVRGRRRRDDDLVVGLVVLVEMGTVSSGGEMQGTEAHSSMGGRPLKFMHGASGPHLEGSQVSTSPEISGHIFSDNVGKAVPEADLKDGDRLVASRPPSESVRTDDELEMSCGETVLESILMRSEKPKGPVLNISVDTEPSRGDLFMAVGRR